MTLILKLADSKEAVLKARAQAQGISAESYAAQVLNRDLEEDYPNSCNPEQRSVWDIFAENRKRVPLEESAKLPKDGSLEHDHYLYGHPKRGR